MTRESCIQTLAEEFAIPMDEAHALYLDIAKYTAKAAKELGIGDFNEEMIMDDFIRRADNTTRRAVVIEAQTAKQRGFLKDKAKLVRTRRKAVFQSSRVREYLLLAKEHGLIGRGLGKVSPTKLVRSILISANVDLPGIGRSASSIREGILSELTAPLKAVMMTDAEAVKVLRKSLSDNNRVREVSRTIFDFIDSGEAEKHLSTEDAFLASIGNTSLSPESRIAIAITRALNSTVDMMNDAGGFVGKRKGYTPVAHSRERIASASVSEWVDAVDAAIDWDRSFPGIDDEHLIRGNASDPAVRAAREAILRDAYETLSGNRVSGKRQGSLLELGEIHADNEKRLNGEMAYHLEFQKQMFFKSGEDWVAYHERFGQSSNIIDVTLSKLNLHARTVSLMQTLGPNPVRGLSLIVERLKNDIESGKVDLPAKMKTKALDELSSFDIENGHRFVPKLEIESLRSQPIETVKQFLKDTFSPADGGLSMAFAEVAGETLHPVNARVAKIASTTRVWKNMSVLGRAVIPAITDVPNTFLSMATKGMTGSDPTRPVGFQTFFQEMVSQYSNHGLVKPKDGGFGSFIEISPYFAAFYDDLLAEFHNRFTMDERASLTRAQAMYFRFSLLSPWTDHTRAAAQRMNMNWIADTLLRNQDGRLAPKLAATSIENQNAAFARYGITPSMFRSLAENCIVYGPDSRMYFIPELVDRISNDEVRYMLRQMDLSKLRDDGFKLSMRDQVQRWAAEPHRFRETIKRNMLAMVNDEVRTAVIESDDKVRYFLLRGTQPGTMAGELLRFHAMFKSYPVSVIDRMYGRNIARMSQGKNVVGPMISWMSQSFTFGLMALWLSDLSKGYEPREISPATVYHAVEKSGMGGAYADYVFRSFSPYDSALEKFVGTAFGPVADSGMELGDVAWEWLRNGDRRGIETFKFMLNNTPFANVFYLRPVADKIFLEAIENSLDPGSVRRRQWYNEYIMGRKPLFKE